MRLIDADALITTVQGTESEVAKNSPYDAEWYTRMADRQREIIGIVERMPTIEQPTIDAVEVVLCKDCKYKDAWREVQELGAKITICDLSGLILVDDLAFCSFGERKENE